MIRFIDCRLLRAKRLDKVGAHAESARADIDPELCCLLAQRLSHPHGTGYDNNEFGLCNSVVPLPDWPAPALRDSELGLPLQID